MQKILDLVQEVFIIRGTFNNGKSRFLKSFIGGQERLVVGNLAKSMSKLHEDLSAVDSSGTVEWLLRSGCFVDLGLVNTIIFCAFISKALYRMMER